MSGAQLRRCAVDSLLTRRACARTANQSTNCATAGRLRSCAVTFVHHVPCARRVSSESTAQLRGDRELSALSCAHNVVNRGHCATAHKLARLTT